MKYLVFATAALAALPAVAHEGGHLPLHVHPHGMELMLAVAVGMALYLRRK